MRPQRGYLRFWYLVGLLWLICTTSDVSAGTYKASIQGKLMGLHQDNDVQVVAQGERAEDHGYRAEAKLTDAAGDAGSEPVVDGKTLGEWLRKLESKDPDDRIGACMALEKMGPAARSAIPALRRALRDEEVTVRILAASTLGGLGSDAATAVPDLVAALRDENEYVRVFAVTALGKIGTQARDGTGAIGNALNDPNALVRSQAEWALQQIGAQEQSTKEKESTKTGSYTVKSSTSDSPQKTSLRSFNYQVQKKYFEPIIIDSDDPRFDGASELVEAAGVGDLAKVELLLKRGVSPDWSIGETRRTPLHEAVAFGRIEVVRALIQAATEKGLLNRIIGATDQRRRIPLHDAAFGGHVTVAGILLDHGAVIDTADTDGLQPLHLAVIKGDDKMVEFLSARGAYLLARDAEGRTAKDYARALHHDHLSRSLNEETLRYWQKPTVIEIRATIENYLAAFGSGDVSAARTLSTKDHDEVFGDSIKALSFQHVIEEIKWDKDAAQATVRIKMPSGMIPFFGFFDLKKNKEGWKVDNTNYGFIEQWEDIK
jgi:ankyrin repeat protein/HEAT repeat protein